MRRSIKHGQIVRWKPLINSHVRLSTLRFMSGHLTIAPHFLDLLVGVCCRTSAVTSQNFPPFSERGLRVEFAGGATLQDSHVPICTLPRLFRKISLLSRSRAEVYFAAILQNFPPFSEWGDGLKFADFGCGLCRGRFSPFFC